METISCPPFGAVFCLYRERLRRGHFLWTVQHPTMPGGNRESKAYAPRKSAADPRLVCTSHIGSVQAPMGHEPRVAVAATPAVAARTAPRMGHGVLVTDSAGPVGVRSAHGLWPPTGPRPTSTPQPRSPHPLFTLLILTISSLDYFPSRPCPQGLFLYGNRLTGELALGYSEC